MTLEAVYSDKAKIPEGLAAHYKEIDGKFVLQANGMKTQGDFDNYADALKKRFADAGADFAKKGASGLSRDDVVEVVNAALEKFAPPGGPVGKPNGKGKAYEKFLNILQPPQTTPEPTTPEAESVNTIA